MNEEGDVEELVKIWSASNMHCTVTDAQHSAHKYNSKIKKTNTNTFVKSGQRAICTAQSPMHKILATKSPGGKAEQTKANDAKGPGRKVSNWAI